MKTLFWRNFIVYSFMILTVFMMFGSVFIIQVDKYAADEKTETLNRTANRVCELTSVILENRNYMIENLYELSISQLASDSDSNIIVCNSQGQIVYFVLSDGSFYTKSVVVPSVPLNFVLSYGSYSNVTNLDGIFSSSMYVIGKPLNFSSVNTNTGAVFIAVSTARTTNLLIRITKVFIYGIMSSLLIALSVSYFLTGYLVRPLRSISNAAKSFSRGDFSVRVPVCSNRDDEITALAISFNNMATSLEHMEEQRRGFVANVSHDLKTPMTTIQGFVDGIIDGTIPPDKHIEYLQRVSEETKRLSRLAVKMLDISKIESGNLVLNKLQFDICEMTSLIILNFEQVLNSKKVNVELDFADNVLVTADRDMMFQVVYNLTDNAVKFVSENGTLKIKISVAQKALVFSISNTGETIPIKDIPYIFDRFYKVDQSRGLNKKGSGLGLYIVKSTVNLHGGKISVESLDGITTFSFKIPIHGHTEIV